MPFFLSFILGGGVLLAQCVVELQLNVASC